VGDYGSHLLERIISSTAMHHNVKEITVKFSAKFAAKTTFAAFAIAGSLAGIAPAAHAERVPTPQHDSSSLQHGCYQMQQDYINGVADYKAAATAGDQAGMDAAGSQLRGAEDGWKAACQGAYGDIGTNLVAPPVIPNGGIDPLRPPVESNPTPNPKHGTGTTPVTPPTRSVN
jgi:hypothetical protein